MYPVLLAGVVATAPAQADEALCLDGPRERVRVEAVLAGDEVRLTDGRVMVTASAAAPRPPLADGREETRRAAEARAAEAREALTARVAGREVELLVVGEDRWGRVLGHLVDISGGQWVEGDLVGEGRSRVVPTSGDTACAEALLVREAEPRRRRLGMWADPLFAVAAPDRALLGRVGDFAVVEGVVRNVRRSGGHVWLNFGSDIARDFAVVMNDKDRSRFDGAGIAVEGLAGRRVVVRGVVGRRGEAPRMAIDDPTAIGRLER